MTGYIYTLYEKADPSKGWVMNDPIFRASRPTLGSCVPNIRRWVKQGDWVFSVSGRVQGQRQFVVGGFKVIEKIDQLAAYERFPENRLKRSENGQMLGNIITLPNGTQHPEDTHTNFAERIKNYLVGAEPVYLETPNEYKIAQEETLPVLSKIFGGEGARVFDFIGRARKLSDGQSEDLVNWLDSVKRRGQDG